MRHIVGSALFSLKFDPPVPKYLVDSHSCGTMMLNGRETQAGVIPYSPSLGPVYLDWYCLSRHQLSEDKNLFRKVPAPAKEITTTTLRVVHVHIHHVAVSKFIVVNPNQQVVFYFVRMHCCFTLESHTHAGHTSDAKHCK